MKQQLIFYNIANELDTILTTLLAEGDPIVLAITYNGQGDRSLDQNNSFIVLNNYTTFFQGFSDDGGEIYLAPGENQQYINYTDQQVTE